MTIYYVGPGGDNGNAGTSWALRKLTLNGAEDIPVVAGDTVYVGPGTYREQLNIDVDGSSGNIITYIGDVTGENTDGIGGWVRVTGSDNDQTSTRASAIDNNDHVYRTYRGFLLDTTTGYTFNDLGNNCTIEDCIFGGIDGGGDYYIFSSGTTQSARTIQRCIFLYGRGMNIFHATGLTATTCVVNNCMFTGGTFGILFDGVGGWVVNSCTFVAIYQALASLGTISTADTIRNSLLQGNRVGIQAGTSGDITEDYNGYAGNNTNLVNVTGGTNSLAYVPYLDVPAPLLDGFVFPHFVRGTLAPWSPFKGITGTSTLSDDAYGATRPTTESKKSWGAVQYPRVVRETGTTHNSSAASLELSDVSRVQFRVPVTNQSTTISVYVYREANYAGTAPQMVIKQPGQSDRTTTDAGSASTWNQLTDTFTPAATPGYVIVELVSNNTATSGSYAVYFDDLEVA